MKIAERGCVYHEPRDWASLESLHCISFCNGEFLNALPEILHSRIGPHLRSTAIYLRNNGAAFQSVSHTCRCRSAVSGIETGIKDRHLHRDESLYLRSRLTCWLVIRFCPSHKVQASRDLFADTPGDQQTLKPPGRSQFVAILLKHFFSNPFLVFGE